MLALAALIMGSNMIAAEPVAAQPASTAATSTTIAPPQPSGIWGLFKAKKGRKYRPAYRRHR
ncbi:hypothetical protein [Hymenobacter daecheongensis]|nr:hypothetical protein [Hymenobacter daecheongensis]